MDKPLVLIRSVLFLFFIFVALIPFSRCNSRVKAIEGKRVKLEFIYPCDSDKITIQRANGAPFYNSAETGYLNLPDRFSVEDKKCSLQVEINPVMKDDEATYIGQAYKDGVFQKLIRVRLDVDYSPGIVSCVPSDRRVGEWVLFHCEASVGSLAGEIICSQDAKRLPPYNDLAQTDKLLKQSVWATEEHPIFCCSSIVDRPKDICECDDFAWDPSNTESVLHPCPSATPTQGTTMKDQLGEISTDRPFPTIVTSLNSITYPDTCHLSPLFLGCVVTIFALLGGSLVLVTLCLWYKSNSNNTVSTEKKDEYTETKELKSMLQEYAFQTKSKNEFAWFLIQRKKRARAKVECESNAESEMLLLYPEYSTV